MLAAVLGRDQGTVLGIHTSFRSDAGPHIMIARVD
jgi:hypothetical protein